MENLLDKWLTQREVKLLLVNTIADIIKSLPVIDFNTSLHESNSEELGSNSALGIDEVLICLSNLKLCLKTLFIHDRLEKHLVLVVKCLLLLFNQLKHRIFFLFTKVWPNIF